MLHIHRAERADALADALTEILLTPLADPFAAEVVAVPTRGMERWLTQRMSTRLGASAGRADGVCANVDFPFPRSLIADALAAATGVDADSDPWAPERLVWPLLRAVDDHVGEDWLSSLDTHLRGAQASGQEVRRFATVRHLADLYDHYGLRRPEMIEAWAVGEDTDGGSRALPDDSAWQAELWRRLRTAIGRPSPAERLGPACQRLAAEPETIELPDRISLFCLTRLPGSYVRVLRALAHARDVHLFVLHPSPTLWARLAAEAPTVTRRRDDPTARLPTNRLLASWGQDARELQLVLADADATAGSDDAADSDATAKAGCEDHHHGITSETRTLLQRIQAGIRADEAPPGPPLPAQKDARPLLRPDDDSIQVHACHGRARQVEVIRDAILHLLQRDPRLEPRDVIVMCPDIETVAPLIQAAFGAGRGPESDEDDLGVAGEGDRRRLPDLRVRLADRSLRQTNPVLAVVSLLLELADDRITASQLLDLADREPVRRRFRFDDDDVSRMEEWVVDSGIRWGLDEDHRAPFKLDVVASNTWRAGLDRILVGVAMTEQDRHLVGGVLPLDDVESGAIDLAGRMAEFVERVHTSVDALGHAQTIEGWVSAIAAAADALTATAERESWQRAELGRILDDVRDDAAADGSGRDDAAADGSGRDDAAATTSDAAEPPRLELADIRALLADRLRGRPTRANFRTGHLTVCTLVPMRSVPHRVVCILGLDDGEFPRKAPRDGDDLLLEDPHVGDRDPRAEDRQMLLDGLLAATERLIITYTGNDERTNLERPPAVPVAELLDVVDRTVRTGSGPDTPLAREQILTRHPLQPFDPRNFRAGELIPDEPWSFDAVALGGARALIAPRHDMPQFLAGPLPALDADVIDLGDVIRFVEHPCRAFLRTRLGISVRESLDEVQDGLPVELGGLERWGVGQRLLDGLLAGAELQECVNAELARGSLPPAMLAAPVLDDVTPTVTALAEAARAHGGTGPATSLDVNLRLPDGRTVAGTVPNVHGDSIRRASYSRVRPRDRLAAWVRLLALSAARPGESYRSAVIGRARQGARHAQTTVAQIAPLDATRALEQLMIIVDLYDRGMRELVPLACLASAAYAHAASSGEDPVAAAVEVWETTFGYDKEDREPEHLLAYGGALPFAELSGEAPRADESGPGWSPSEDTRFGRYARRLWDGLLTHEELRDR
jgi:exodeoxyribonuclease V gamma subunit